MSRSICRFVDFFFRRNDSHTIVPVINHRACFQELNKGVRPLTPLERYTKPIFDVSLKMFSNERTFSYGGGGRKKEEPFLIGVNFT